METPQHRASALEDAHYTARTLHDAELIKGGAIYSFGRLVVTHEQLAQLRTAEDENKDPLEFLALLTDQEEQLRQPVDADIAAIENREDVRHTLATVVEPYGRAFSELVPSPSQNKRSLLGKLKTQPVDIPLPPKRKMINTMDAQFNLAISYQPGETANHILSASMGIEDLSEPNESRSSYQLQFNYAGGSVCSIVIDGHNFNYPITESYKVHTLSSLENNVTPPSPLNAYATFMQEVAPLAWGVQIDLQQLAIIITEPHNKVCSYRYDASRDDFVLAGDSTHLAKGTLQMRPAAVSNEEVTAIVKSLLEIIPAQKV